MATIILLPLCVAARIAERIRTFIRDYRLIAAKAGPDLAVLRFHSTRETYPASRLKSCSLHTFHKCTAPAFGTLMDWPLAAVRHYLISMEIQDIVRK